MNYLILGDKPSPKMFPGARPFVGTVCEKRFYAWLKQLKLNPKKPNVYVHNQSEFNDELLNIIILHLKLPKVIALGNNVSRRLKKLNIPHFKLPHPSGLNRQINDEKFIDQKLKECRMWLKK